MERQVTDIRELANRRAATAQAEAMKTLSVEELTALASIDHHATNIQIQISADGRTVWINGDHGCLFRASRIDRLQVDDLREGK